VEHRLATFLCGDIVGYTGLMVESEAPGLHGRERHRGLLRPLATCYHGKIVDETGDELLFVFPSDLDAVNCALAAQAALRDDPELTLRIGIHAGDVVVDAINNQPDVQAQPLGKQPLKRVAHPLAVYAVPGSTGEPSRLRVLNRPPALRRPPPRRPRMREASTFGGCPSHHPGQGGG
jgi:hypothetical protein